MDAKTAVMTVAKQLAPSGGPVDYREIEQRTGLNFHTVKTIIRRCRERGEWKWRGLNSNKDQVSKAGEPDIRAQIQAEWYAEMTDGNHQDDDPLRTNRVIRPPLHADPSWVPGDDQGTTAQIVARYIREWKRMFKPHLVRPPTPRRRAKREHTGMPGISRVRGKDDVIRYRVRIWNPETRRDIQGGSYETFEKAQEVAQRIIFQQGITPRTGTRTSGSSSRPGAVSPARTSVPVGAAEARCS